jgi:phage terminase large subunit-like protein
MPSSQAAFLTKHLNIWVNADVSWLGPGAWARCGDQKLKLEQFDGQPCYVGIDLAQRSDIAAVMLYFPPDHDRKWGVVFGRYYLPEETVDRAENSHYQGWERSGLLTATDGAVTDFDAILDDLDTFAGQFDVLEFCSDPWKNVPLVNALQKRGITIPIVDVRQSAQNMSPAMVELEGQVMGQTIRHNGDPVLDWMIHNVLAHRGWQDTIQPRKSEEDKKIDGVTGLLMCIHRAMKRGGAKADYENRGLWSV